MNDSCLTEWSGDHISLSLHIYDFPLTIYEFPLTIYDGQILQLSEAALSHIIGLDTTSLCDPLFAAYKSYNSPFHPTKVAVNIGKKSCGQHWKTQIIKVLTQIEFPGGLFLQPQS